ncbi:MAG: GNAT family N-acetyltransferase [Sulfuricurvum sp.]
MNTIQIRLSSFDDADIVVPLLIEAMGDIAYRLSGTNDHDECEAILKSHFLGENSRISYRRCWVIESDGKICGAIACYGGDRAGEYDEWARAEIRKRFQYDQPIDPECEKGEFYIDSIAISPLYRGKRFSALLIEKSKEIAKEGGYERVSLIVDEEKSSLKHYYQSLGFNEDGLKEVYQHSYAHMIFSL